MSSPVSEQSILAALRQVPVERWNEVLRFLGTLQDAGPAIRTGFELSEAELVGLWADRDDLGSSVEFARALRQQAQTRQGTADVAGH
jgi:hypothetical protein